MLALFITTLTVCTQMPKCNGNAYAVLATNENTWGAAHVLAFSLLHSGTRSDIVVMHEGHSYLHLLKNNNQIRYRKVTPSRARGNGPWESTYNKFWAGRMVQYCHVMLLDADMIVLHNIDHLFSTVDNTNVVFAAPTAYWISPTVFCSCLIVLKPSSTLFGDVLERADGKHREDMDYFNFRHSAQTRRLDPTYAALIGEWYPRDRIYHRLQQNISVVHFIAEWKPFSFVDWSVDLDLAGVYVYSRWWEYARALDLHNRCSNWKSVHSAFWHFTHQTKQNRSEGDETGDR